MSSGSTGWSHRGRGQCTAGMVPALCPASSFSCLLWTLCPRPGWGLGEVVHPLPQGGALRPGNLRAGRHPGASGSRQSQSRLGGCRRLGADR